jgi:UDP-glucose 4-epimerase
VAESKTKIVAITGTTDFLGALLLKALLKAPWCSRVIALDAFPPPHHAKVVYHPLQLERMEEERGLAALLRHHKCTTFIHAALPVRPMRSLERSHEILSVATMYLLHAVAEAKMKHLILASTAEVYGAKPTNPNLISEDAPRHAGRGNPFLKDKIEVEEQFEHYADQHPDAVVTILRTCTILGDTSTSLQARFIHQRVVPTVAGYDPLIQFVHEHDVVRAYEAVMQHPRSGIYNIVGEGVVPLSKAIGMARKTALPIPSPLLYIAADMLWQASISPVPSANLDFLKYSCVADGEKARQELKFTPTYNTEETLISFLDSHRVEE